MKRTIALLALGALILVALAACNTPQPLPVAPTPIPTLIPATLPPPDQGAAEAVTAGVVFPSAPPSQAAGETIFKENCASCHGEDGTGKVDKARNFTDADYMRAAAPVDFFQTVSGGRDAMPGFKDKLSDEQRWSAVYYLWGFSVKQDMLAQGKTAYEANCVACHGPDGQGAIPQAAKFSPEFISKYPTTQFYQSVSGGKGIMPAWQDRLGSDERWAAIEYARSFAYEPLGK
jgi:cytochrome c oxidase cbb3-type subunit 3